MPEGALTTPHANRPPSSHLALSTAFNCDTVRPCCAPALPAAIEDAAVDSEGEYESALLGESDGAVLDAALPCLQHLTALVSCA